MNEKIKELLAAMTLEEKASLCSGADFWHLKSVERLGIPQIMVSDGPHGLRKQDGASDHVGVADSVPATCFPTSSATASSWDAALMGEIGKALAEECLQEEVSVILGPGVNLKRSPLCGRNFEYISEDPFLAGEMAAALIQGVQGLGVGTSLKHFAANSQEHRRMSIDSVIDERTLRELYLPAFETAVKKGRPWTVMCAYNRLNGSYCSQNEWLLSELLREEWGFEGIVVTDWGACDDRVLGLKAGQDLEMPSPGGHNDKSIVRAVKRGDLPLAVLDRTVARILELILKAQASRRPGFRYDAAAHHALARRAARESMVLLRNEGSFLPLKAGTRLALIGDFAERPRFQGAGSSLINPSRLDTLKAELGAYSPDFVYAKGYSQDSDLPDEALIAEAVAAARAAEAVILCVGLTAAYEMEGCDRSHLRLPASHERLIEAVCAANPRSLVLLSNGAAVEMPWIQGPAAVLEGFLAGQAGAGAALDLIFGAASPSGKLAESYPLALADLPSSAHYREGPLTVEYREGLYVGYRYFDSAGKKPLFPFGFGLSYTSFEYSDLRLSAPSVAEGETLTVSFTVANTGKVAGAEIAQLYVHDREASVYRPYKELKGFAKVFLEAGERKSLSLSLDSRAFSFWDSGLGDWRAEPGDFDILVGPSSAELALSASLRLSPASTGAEGRAPLGPEDLPSYFKPAAEGLSVGDEEFCRLYGRALPPRAKAARAAFDLSTPLGDTRSSFVGRLLFNFVLRTACETMIDKNDKATLSMMEEMVSDMPVRNIVSLSGGHPGYGVALLLLFLMNLGRSRSK